VSRCSKILDRLFHPYSSFERVSEQLHNSIEGVYVVEKLSSVSAAAAEKESHGNSPVPCGKYVW
jgi:hypothetical protein